MFSPRARSDWFGVRAHKSASEARHVPPLKFEFGGTLETLETLDPVRLSQIGWWLAT